jgi:hypothetical protein
MKYLYKEFSDINNSANLARKGHSVLVLEAGEDNGASLLQQVPPL